MKTQTQKRLDALIKAYAVKMNGMVQSARRKVKAEGGKLNGVIKAEKAKQVEELTEKMVKIAWEIELGKASKRLRFDKKKVPIRINQKIKYANAKTPAAKKFIETEGKTFSHNLSVDRHVFVDDKMVLAIECKAYSENTMLKRGMVDFHLLKTQFSKVCCYLVQLENSLGGDYGVKTKNPKGSPASHVVMSYFPKVELQIITLLAGNRNEKQPIHTKKFFKPLTIDRLYAAVEAFVQGFQESGVA